MPAKDVFHDAVINGLEKEGWVITEDPLEIEIGTLPFIQIVLQRSQLKLIVYDPRNEEIVSWKN